MIFHSYFSLPEGIHDEMKLAARLPRLRRAPASARRRAVAGRGQCAALRGRGGRRGAFLASMVAEKPRGKRGKKRGDKRDFTSFDVVFLGG